MPLLCDFLIGVGLSHQVYVMRNHSSNVEWNKGFTLDSMNRSMHSQSVEHYLPYSVPTDYRHIKFSHFLEEHLLRYDGHLDPKESHRMLLSMINPFTSVFGSLTDGHSCDHTGKPSMEDYFIGAKGAGVNVHQHQEIYHQLISGRKLFLIVDDYSVLKDVLGPLDAIGPKVKKLLNMDDVKKCIIEPGDIMHLPKNTIHGVFNLETSISSGCVIYEKY